MDKQNKTGHTLTYIVNGKPKRINIKENDFYAANEKALNILKNERELKGRFSKKMNIKLHSNKTNTNYELEWKKHPPLSGQGGYFTTFKSMQNKNEKDKNKKVNSDARIHILLLLTLIVGALTTYLTLKGNKNPEVKFEWFMVMLVYSVGILLLKSDYFKKGKSKWDILFKNVLLESPILLGAYFTMDSFIKEDAITDKVLYISVVVILLFVKLAINYGNERDKNYYDRISS